MSEFISFGIFQVDLKVDGSLKGLILPQVGVSKLYFSTQLFGSYGVLFLLIPHLVETEQLEICVFLALTVLDFFRRNIYIFLGSLIATSLISATQKTFLFTDSEGVPWNFQVSHQPRDFNFCLIQYQKFCRKVSAPVFFYPVFGIRTRLIKALDVKYSHLDQVQKSHEFLWDQE